MPAQFQNVGKLIAIIVLIVAIVLVVIGQLDLKAGAMFAAISLAVILS